MANEYLKRTPTSTGNGKVFTWSGWVKKQQDAYEMIAFSGPTTVSDGLVMFGWGTTTGLYLNFYSSSASRVYEVDEDFRDFGSWLHYQISVDTTQVTEDDRINFYINGAQKSLSVVSGYSAIPQNYLMDNMTAGKQTLLGAGRNSSGTLGADTKLELSDIFFVDGQALTPDVFGFYKDGDGYIAVGSTQATDFRPGQWMPHSPSIIKKSIERSGGFGVNGYYLPMNDSSNPGADFHCAPNSIITLKGEDLPQPRNGAPTTTDAYVSQLRQEVSTLGFDGVVKFDGDGDYLSLSTTSDFAFGTGDFTVEFWAWIESSQSSTLQPIFDNDYNSAGGLAIAIRHSDSRIFVGDNGSGLNLCQFNAPFALNSWNHFAVVADSGTYKAFVNGTSCSLGLGSATVVDTSRSSGTTEIGRLVGQTSLDAAAFISNLRVVKGTALYTSNFTAPTEPLTDVTNTKLLCCNSSTSATASTVTPGTITANGDVFATRNELTGSTVLAVPGISTSTSANLVTNGNFDSNVSGWTASNSTIAWSNGTMQITRSGGGGPGTYQVITTEVGKRYTIFGTINSSGSRGDLRVYDGTGFGGTLLANASGTNGQTVNVTSSFTASSTTSSVVFSIDNNGTTIFVDNIVIKQEDAPRDYSADIKGSGTNKTLTPSGNAGVGYELGNYYGSAMTSQASGGFSFAGSDFVFGTGDFTFECWFYISADTSEIRTIFDTRTSDNDTTGVFLGINTNDQLYTYAWPSGTAVVEYGIPAINQWHHVALVRNGSVGTVYLNGVAVGTSNVSAANYTESGGTLLRPSDVFGTSFSFAGHVQDARVYKGVAKYKGGFDVPKPYTPVGIESWRQVSDTCKNNFATLNSIDAIENVTLSEGNLHWNAPNSGAIQGGSCRSTINITSGKWYWEVQNTLAARYHIGLLATNAALPTGDAGTTTTNWVFRSDGYAVHNNGERVYGSDCDDTTGITVMVAFDSDTGKLYFGKNGTWFGNGNPALGTSEPAFSNIPVTGGVSPFLNRRSGANGAAINFGQNPSFGGRVAAGTYTDSNGKGLFKYQPPSGFLALCEDNLPTPTIKDPGEHFKTVLWTGDSNSGRSITGVGFQPDFVWYKWRSSADSHGLFDSVRGATKRLRSNGTDAESTTSGLISFDYDGFSLGTDSSANLSGGTYVAWCWKAGGAAVSNTDGSITSQVSANQDAGFSIVTATMVSGVKTIGHGLEKTPKFIITKQTNGTTGWYCYHSALGATKNIRLDLSNAEATSSSIWNDTKPTSSVFTMGSGFGNSESYVAYCWAEIEGYSKFGSYVGNGNADGPFVYCGFKPAWLMIKRTDATQNWPIIDSSRDSVNVANRRLFANLSDIEDQGIPNFVDLLSNGFKCRDSNVSYNASGGTYIFAAFAESPFQTANAK